MNRMTEAYCINCQSAKAFSNFHNHVIVGKKYLPICKTCCNKKLKDYIAVTKNDAAGLWCLLAELGIPFLREVWEPTQKIVFESTNAGRKPDLFLMYIRTLKELGIIVEGFWQSNMMLSDFMKIGKDNKKEEEVKEVVDLNEQQRIWGKFEPEDYEFLNFTFNEYTQELLEMDANLIRRYRDLAKAELRKRKADESGDMNEIKNAQSVLNNQLTLLKLNNFKDNKQSDTEKFIERMAWNIENTKPSECEDTEIYKDYSNFGVKWEDILRTVKNLVAGTREYPDIPKDEL
jgi:hypothetical protein|uniref:Uncharacterized protein n=1 Tax=Siphoviridae sp. ct0Wl9 TaxID=2827763 RepID=A0A8S5T8K2_9CAUD|nr:MAG TPA: hypothetical protein [Siphoviridae sp. ct0Wl9]